MKKIVVKRYKKRRQYEHDAGRMLRRGYEVQSVVSEERQRGAMMKIMFLLPALIFKPKPVLVVTYRLAA